MKNRSYLFLVVLMTLLAGCGSSKLVVSHYENAVKAETEGNYAAAVEAWDQYFNSQLSSNMEIAPANYAQAGKVAFKAGRFDLAESWLGAAESANYTDQEIYFDLARIYRDKDNLSKELLALESCHKSFPDPSDETGMNTRLFDIYSQAGNVGKAQEFWPLMKVESHREEKYLDHYFSIQQKLKNSELADSVALELVKINPKHVDALEWLGKKYYNEAEEHYQREMKAYEKKKTHLQYQYLLTELKKVTTEFKKSLEYFDVLWEMDQNQHYASYLVNIYTRLDNADKANYYRKFIK